MNAESTIAVADGADLFEDEAVLGTARVPHMSVDEPEGKRAGARDRQKKKTGAEPERTGA